MRSQTVNVQRNKKPGSERNLLKASDQEFSPPTSSAENQRRKIVLHVKTNSYLKSKLDSAATGLQAKNNGYALSDQKPRGSSLQLKAQSQKSIRKPIISDQILSKILCTRQVDPPQKGISLPNICADARVAHQIPNFSIRLHKSDEGATKKEQTARVRYSESKLALPTSEDKKNRALHQTPVLSNRRDRLDYEPPCANK